MLAMNATPASTPTGRSQLVPSGPVRVWRHLARRLDAGVRDWVASVPPAGSGSLRSRGQGRKLGQVSGRSRGRESGHTQ